MEPGILSIKTRYKPFKNKTKLFFKFQKLSINKGDYKEIDMKVIESLSLLLNSIKST